ncbi:RimK family alpha-L-glutamate ligase [Puerhibacterium sp. TATVAM-FAB25]|uniref:ATP-grasp domain-containing protein n=1 Tax=Puerhibacterium sp. TATVAM-FAB25 TaxID=3093699 RepID=UPI00397DCB2E
MSTENPTSRRVALVTSSQLPELDADDRPLVPALAERGVTAEPVVWDDPDVDWDAYDLVVVRSTWDYSARRDEFVAWAERVPRLANPAAVLRWNTDKRYLRALEEAGVPVIPTIWLDPDRHLSKRAVHTRMPAFGDFVVKPVVSAGAKDTGRYQPISAESRALAIQHTMSLLDSGRWVMIQSYVESVDTQGETCLTFVDGELRHATHKKALLSGPAEESSTYREEEISPVEATAAQLDVAQRALQVAAEVVGLAEPLLYARVDLVEGEDGVPTVIELELTEPSLFLQHAGEARTLDAVADAIAKRV